MAYNGTGASLQIGKETTFGTGVTPTNLVDFTSESIATSVDKGDEGSLLASKTAMSRDLMGINVDGSIDMVLRPQVAGLIMKAVMGGTDTVTTSGTHHKHSIVLADPSAALPSLTVIVDRKSKVSKFTGVTIGSASISANAGDYVTCNLSLVGVKEETGTLASGLTLTVPAYRCTQATFKVGGTSYDITSATWSVDNALEEAPKTYGTGLYKGQPMHGQRAVNISIEIPRSTATDALVDAHLTTEVNASVELVFTSTNADYSFTVKMPNVAFTAGSGTVNGAGVLTQSFEGTALSVGTTEPVTVEIIDDTATAY